MSRIMQKRDLYNIDSVIVRREVYEKNFQCDLSKCKGACCTLESHYGAPVTDEEIEIINEYLPEIKKFLTTRHVEAIEEEGFWENKEDSLMIKSINNRECVFVYYEGDVAKCAIEKAFYDGKIDFKKPISCHLFPIRVSTFGGDILRYEKMKECEPAVENGTLNNMTVAEFCKDSLIRLYGLKWYQKFSEFIRS